MKLLILFALVASCGFTDKQGAAEKTQERIKPDRHKYTMSKRQDRIIKCVEGFLEKDVAAESSYNMCKDMFARKK